MFRVNWSGKLTCGGYVRDFPGARIVYVDDRAFPGWALNHWDRWKGSRHGR